MPIATYLYQKTNSALEELTTSTGLSPTSSIWSLSDQLTLVFASTLNAAEKITLDDYLVNNGYEFVLQT